MSRFLKRAVAFVVVGLLLIGAIASVGAEIHLLKGWKATPGAGLLCGPDDGTGPT